MKLGQKLSICWGQRRRHLSLGVPHSSCFHLCPMFSPSCFYFSSILTHSMSDIQPFLCPPFLLYFFLTVTAQSFFISLSFLISSLSLCTAPTQTLLRGSPLLSRFMHPLTSSLFQYLSNSPSLSPALLVS